MWLCWTDNRWVFSKHLGSCFVICPTNIFNNVLIGIFYILTKSEFPLTVLKHIFSTTKCENIVVHKLTKVFQFSLTTFFFRKKNDPYFETEKKTWPCFFNAVCTCKLPLKYYLKTHLTGWDLLRFIALVKHYQNITRQIAFPDICC